MGVSLAIPAPARCCRPIPAAPRLAVVGEDNQVHEGRPGQQKLLGGAGEVTARPDKFLHCLCLKVEQGRLRPLFPPEHLWTI